MVTTETKHYAANDVNRIPKSASPHSLVLSAFQNPYYGNEGDLLDRMCTSVECVKIVDNVYYEL